MGEVEESAWVASGASLEGACELRMRPIKTSQRPRAEGPVPNGGSMDSSWADEPMTPAGRVFTEMNPIFVCIVILGFKHHMDYQKFKTNFELTIMKHKRFSSRVEVRNGKPWWTQVKTNVDDHVFQADLTPDQTENMDCIMNYATDVILPKPFDPSKPLWDVYLLNAKCGEAESFFIARIHHALGDGTSLISLLMACTRRVDQSDSLPAAIIASESKKAPDTSFVSKLFAAVWKFLTVFWSSLTEIGRAAATLTVLKDSSTVIQGFAGIEHTPKIFRFVTVSLDEMKYVSKLVGMTVNDLYIAMAALGLRRYLDHRAQEDLASEETECSNEEQINGVETTGEVVKDPGPARKGAEKKLGSLRIRAVALINLRSSPGLQEMSEMMNGQASQARWGNQMGYLLLPLPMKYYSDPVELLFEARSISNRKKSSLEGPFSYATGELLMRLFGQKVAAAVVTRSMLQTSVSLSNVRGPSEQVMFADNPITDIIPSVVGHPHALTLHLQSYNGKAAFVIMAAKNTIPDPEYFLQLCVDALREFKIAAEKKAGNR